MKIEMKKATGDSEVYKAQSQFKVVMKRLFKNKLAVAGLIEGNFTEEGLALVRDGDDWGYIDDSGEFVIEANFADASSFSEGLAKVKEDPEDDWYYIDTDGEEAFQGTYKYASSFKNGMARVSDDGEEYGYIDDSGEMVIKEQFAKARDFHADGYAIVGEKDDKGIIEYYVIDEDGEAIWSETYRFVGTDSEQRSIDY